MSSIQTESVSILKCVTDYADKYPGTSIVHIDFDKRAAWLDKDILIFRKTEGVYVYDVYPRNPVV